MSRRELAGMLCAGTGQSTCRRRSREIDSFYGKDKRTLFACVRVADHCITSLVIYHDPGIMIPAHL